MALDVLRAVANKSDAASGVLAKLADEAGGLPGGGDAASFVRNALTRADAELMARAAVGRLAQLAAAAALRENAPAVAALFARTRLHAHHHALHGGLLGTSEITADEAAFLIDRALSAY